MSINWGDALSQNTTFTKISSATGAYHGYFLGFSDTWESNENCYDCKGQPGNDDCKKCKGHGKRIETKIALKYDLGDGTKEQEQMTFKISPPRQINGQPVRSSKLYERLTTLSGLQGAGPGDLGRWGAANKDCRIPVLVIIKQPGNYPKITEVIAREENQSQTGQNRLPEGASGRTKEIAAHRQPARSGAKEIPKDFKFERELDDEIPF